jgi:putative DNA primase/helicase
MNNGIARGQSYLDDMAVKGVTGAVRNAVASMAAQGIPKPPPIIRNAPEGDSVPLAWPEPQAIPCSLLPVESFNNELLPEALRGWVTDIAERMQCPPDFPAVGAMVALSSVIGRKICVQPKRQDDWQVIPNLWGAIVGRPGVMKSPALSEVMKPLDRLTIIANDLHAEAMRDHEIKLRLESMSGKDAEKKAQQAIAKGNVSGAEQLLRDAIDADGIDPPPLRRYKVTDASVEALGEILIENPWGTLAYRDELSGLLRSLDKEGQEGSRAFYLQGYDGNQGYTFDRIMRGRNLHISAVCIAMLGGIQPGKLQSYIRDAVSGGAGDDGLLQRFGLLVWPDISGEWRNVDRWPDTPAKLAAFETFKRLDAKAPGTDPDSGEQVPLVYRFSTDAQALFEEWRQDFETALRTGEHHPAMESHLAKYRKLVPAVALVCALADDENDVSKASLLRALAWSEYLQTHAARAYTAGTRPATEGAAALLAKIKAGIVPDGFKPADVYLKGWAHLGTPEDTHAAIGMLCDLHHLRRIETPPGIKGGRPAITYLINPATKGGN